MIFIRMPRWIPGITRIRDEAGEIDVICSAIYHHSSKEITHAPFDEVLKDADVMQHCLYNPLFEVMKHEKERFGKMKEEFGLTGREP